MTVSVRTFLSVDSESTSTKKKKKNSKRKQTLKESSSSQSVTEETKCFIYNSQLENQDVYYRGVNKGLVIPSCQCLRHLNMVVVCNVLIITVSYKTQQTCLRMSAMANGIENKANLPDTIDFIMILRVLHQESRQTSSDNEVCHRKYCVHTDTH